MLAGAVGHDLRNCVWEHLGSDGDRTLTGKDPLQVRAVLATLGRPIAYPPSMQTLGPAAVTGKSDALFVDGWGDCEVECTLRWLLGQARASGS